MKIHFFSSHYDDWVYLQRDDPVEKITYRLLGDPSLSLLIKPVNTEIEPTIQDISQTLREWCWEAHNTPPYDYESDQPIWHNPPAHVKISQYNSWNEVAQKLDPLYSLPKTFASSIPLEMQALLEKWSHSTKGSTEKALLALRFVQDEIRYLGIEEGMGAFQPTDPCLTFQRRFGDCKDKAFLLHALLQLMDISSKPLLVHTSKGEMLPDALPSPGVFDHLVLQLEINGTVYWADPTCSLQGGSLQTNFFPNYGWGLLLLNNSEALIPLPKMTFRFPTEIDTSYILESKDSALLSIKSIFYDSKADRLRRSVKWNGLKTISENSLSALQEFYGAATLNVPMEIFDDRTNNTMTLVESYRIPTLDFLDTKVMEIFSHTLRNYLQNRINPERSSPCEICYPLWVKEKIHIENPFFQWESFQENYKKELEPLSYSLCAQISKNSADFEFELKHLQDYIPKHALRDYWHIVNEISQKSPPRMTIASLATPDKDSDGLLSFAIIAICVWVFFYFFSRKKRELEDLLTFYLKNFQNFHSIILVFGFNIITKNQNYSILISIATIFIISKICNHILLKRSIRTVLSMQIMLLVQICLLSCFVFFREECQILEKILIFCGFCLHFASSFKALQKAKALLIEEKKQWL